MRLPWTTVLLVLGCTSPETSRPYRDASESGPSSIDASSDPISADRSTQLDSEADRPTPFDGSGNDDANTPRRPVGPRLDSFTPSGPITLSSGQTVSGLRITSQSGPCIRGEGVSNVRILDNQIGPCGDVNDTDGIGVSIHLGSDIEVGHNSFDNVASAFYIAGEGAGRNIAYHHNYSTNVRGPRPRGQMAQFNTVRGPGLSVTCNISDEDAPGIGVGPEDHISTYASFGTPASPFIIQYNKIRGGGPSLSGGGILSGDNDAEYIHVLDNILISPGQYGLSVAGGRHARFSRNVVYSPTAFPWSNVGMFAWEQAGSNGCFDNEMSNNRIFFVHREGFENHSWLNGNCEEPIGWDTNVFGDTTLTAAVWDTVFEACL